MNLNRSHHAVTKIEKFIPKSGNHGDEDHVTHSVYVHGHDHDGELVSSYTALRHGASRSL